MIGPFLPRRRIAAVCALLLAAASQAAAPADVPREITLREEPGRLEIRAGEKTIATYVYRDDKTLRPHFSNVFTPDGIRVTRHHPPRPEIDATDHAELHPGIWLAFGDLGGSDFWRNKGRVEHVEFVEPPQASGAKAAWTVRNRYRDGDRIVCEEVCRHTIELRPAGWLLTYDSDFRSEAGCAFGDQEEMGLGLRVATPLTVKGGAGRMLDRDGRLNEAQVRGTRAAWCDYGGAIDGRRAGLVLMPHPENFRRSWYHARDYGFIAANPFGRNALTGGEKSRVEIGPGEAARLRLRFGVLIYSEAEGKEFDRNAEYRHYAGVEAAARERRKLYNLDGDSCLFRQKGSRGPEEITPADLKTIVEVIAHPEIQIDTLPVCINAQEMSSPTKAGMLRGTPSSPAQRAERPAGGNERG